MNEPIVLSGRERVLALLWGPGDTTTWLREHLDHQDQKFCLIWPFAWKEGGYPAWGYPPHTVHRLMCEYRNGPPPTPKHQSAHSCGRGTQGCVNPWHISWKTNAENQHDRRRHDADPRRYRLTWDDVNEIRRLSDSVRVADLAKQFGVSFANIKLIQAGKTWRIDRKGPRVFTVEEILRIRASTGPASRFAKEYGVSTNTIYGIRNRKFYSHVEDRDCSHSSTERA